MTEDIKTEEALDIDMEFFNDVKWELIKNNKIDKENFIKLKAKNNKLYATFLGAQDNLSFFAFKPLDWDTYKAVRSQDLDKYETHELILNSSIVWPLLNERNMPDAGTILTLVYQILAQSSFLKDPSQALKMIVEI